MEQSVKDVSVTKTCDLCGFTTDNDEDVISFGDWMTRQDITVHYFCLLLSTNLPQNGQDSNGILGFLVRDIRKEIRDAQTRKCSYCDEMRASISCFKCKKYFHLVCGHRYDCTFTFIGDFHSYCDECVPLDECQLQNKEDPPRGARCHICTEPMGKYNPITWIYGRCCNNGYVHRLCLRRYALAAGYYLICIFCRSKDFRNDVRLQGIFVPDRDARWERERNAYADLHRGHQSCNMTVCNCPKGRDYMRGYWSSIIVCSLCGSYGAHNPGCIPGHEQKKVKVKSFTCDPCRFTTESMSKTEREEIAKAKREACRALHFDYQLQMHKKPAIKSPKQTSPQQLNETPQFSEDESISFSSYATTVRAAPNFKPPVELVSNVENNVENNAEDMQVDDDVSPAETADEATEETHNPTVITLDDTTQELEESQNHQSQEATKEIAKEKPTTLQHKSPSPEKNTADMSLNSFSRAIGLQSNPSPEFHPKIFIVENWPEFDEQKLNVLSTCKVRIDLSNPRFAGKSIEEICSFKGMHLIEDADKFDRISGPGIFKIIDDFIAKQIKSVNKTKSDRNSLDKTEQSYQSLKLCDNETKAKENEGGEEQATSCSEAVMDGELNQSAQIDKTVEKLNQKETEQEQPKKCQEQNREEEEQEGNEAQNLEKNQKENPEQNLGQNKEQNQERNQEKNKEQNEEQNQEQYEEKSLERTQEQNPEKSHNHNQEKIQEQIEEQNQKKTQEKYQRPIRQKTQVVYTEKRKNLHQKQDQKRNREPNINQEHNYSRVSATQRLKKKKHKKRIRKQQNIHGDHNYSYSEPHMIAAATSSPKTVSLKSSAPPQRVYIVENWPEFDEHHNVLATCKVRIDLRNPRFARKSIEEICSFDGMHLIEDADKFDRISGPGIYKEIDDFIAFMQK